jgi:hypothetical protein
MKKATSIIFFFLASVLLLKGQSEMITIAVLSAKSDYGAGGPADQKNISEMVSQSFAATGRFNLFDDDRLRQSMYDYNLLDVPVNESNAHSFCIIGNLLGIQYFVVANIKNVSTKAVIAVTGKPAYTAHMVFSLKLIDVATGKIGEVVEFDSYGALSGFVNMSYDTEQSAVLSTITGMKEDVTSFIDEQFPISFPLISIIGQKNNSAVKVEILGGKSMGLTKNVKLKVLLLTTVAYDGQQLEKRRQIGTVKITEVQGDQISEASVLDGGKEILEAFNTNNRSLVCETE